MKNNEFKELSKILKDLVKNTDATIAKYQNMIKTNPLINGDFSFSALEKKDYDYIKEGLKKLCLELLDLTEYAQIQNENADVDKVTDEYMSGERDIEELIENIDKIFENN